MGLKQKLQRKHIYCGTTALHRGFLQRYTEKRLVLLSVLTPVFPLWWSKSQSDCKFPRYYATGSI